MATSNLHKYTSQEALNVITAGGGYDYVTDATVNSHTYCAITALSVDAVVSATSIDTDIWDSLSSVEIPSGTTIYGKWTAVTIGSGDLAMVYRESSSD